MTAIYYDKDVDISVLEDKTISIIGYGSQGHAHALNLRDSGKTVIVGLYNESPSWQKAEKDGLTVVSTEDAARLGDIIMVLIPDHIQRRTYQENIEPQLTPGKTLMFAHGFSIHFNEVNPPDFVNVSMIAPKAPGHRMREHFIEGIGVPALLAIQQDPTGQAKALSLAYAQGVGCTKAGVLETTFKDETETDLFGEQTVLCGGVSGLIKAGFEILVEAGYSPVLAYFECLHEVKLIVDLLYQGGLSYMRYSISDTAEYGDYSRGPRIIDEETKSRMRIILKEIQDGHFAKEWISENDEGRKRFLQMRKEETDHPIEEVGRKLRAMMPWLNPLDKGSYR